MFLSIKQPVCEKMTKSVNIFDTVSLDRHHYIHLFSNLALLEQNKYEKEINIEEEKIYSQQIAYVQNLTLPSEVKFYTDNVHASVTNSMSDWWRRRNRRRKRRKRRSRWRRIYMILIIL